AGVCRRENAPASNRPCMIDVSDGKAIERAVARVLRRPVRAAVERGEDRPVVADGPTVVDVSEADRCETRTRGLRYPVHPTVGGGDDAAVAECPAVVDVNERDVTEIRRGAGRLRSPMHAAVDGRDDRALPSDRPAVAGIYERDTSESRTCCGPVGSAVRGGQK